MPLWQGENERKLKILKTSKRMLALAVAALLTLGTLTGCTDTTAASTSSSSAISQSAVSQAPSAAPETSSAAPETPGTGKIIDREGKEITIPASCERIISMAPSITETLVHLGLSQRLVAVDKYSAEVEGIPANLPVYDIMAPDTESLSVLAPDIVFATGMSRTDGDDPFAALTALGVQMTYIPSAVSLEGIRGDILFLGEMTGTKDKAKVIVEEMDEEIVNIVETIGEKQGDSTVYFEIGAEPSLYSFGSNTFLNEIIDLLGASNVLADQQSWVAVSEEVVLKKNPDVLFTNVDYLEDPVKAITTRNGWAALSAVKEGRVYQIDKNASSRPNESVVIAMRQMAAALYPDLFPAS